MKPFALDAAHPTRCRWFTVGMFRHAPQHFYLRTENTSSRSWMIHDRELKPPILAEVKFISVWSNTWLHVVELLAGQHCGRLRLRYTGEAKC